jgi:hypothetical protein
MSTNLESILNRIRKLLALSKSPNENEAAAAANAAAKLQEEYQIESAQLELNGEDFVVDPIDAEILEQEGLRKSSFKGLVVVGVAKMTGIRAWTVGTTYKFFGRQSATRTAIYMCQYLWQTIEDLAKSEYAASNTPVGAVRWKSAFKLGCAGRIQKRLFDLAKENEVARNNAINAGSQALILVRKKDLEVAKAFAQLDLHLRKNPRANIGSREGYDAGTRAGDGVSLGGGRAQLGPAPGRIES